MLELKKPNEKQRKLISHSVCKCHFAALQQTVAFGGKADIEFKRGTSANAGPVNT
jgi:hypothetical protein